MGVNLIYAVYHSRQDTERIGANWGNDPASAQSHFMETLVPFIVAGPGAGVRALIGLSDRFGVVAARHALSLRSLMGSVFWFGDDADACLPSLNRPPRLKLRAHRPRSGKAGLMRSPLL